MKENSNKKVNVITFGCSKNVVDSEKIMSKLSKCGYEVVFDSNDTDAKIVIINTCGFIADAKEQSLDSVIEFAYAKKNGIIEQLFVVGCLSERYREELRKEIGEVDEFFGTLDIAGVIDVITKENMPNELGIERIQTTPTHYAYLKISEGCNWKCSYCAIPLMRGKHVSQPIELIVEEAQLLVAKGVKEVLLIAQDLTYYGLDIYSRRALADLLKELVKIDGLEWIKLHYAYPFKFPKDVIELMKVEPKICDYLDIPFQHINSEILSSMERHITSTETMDLIKYIRGTVENIALRTTLIVGYPGETIEQYEELREFVRDVKFERLGVFAYCSEEGTPAGELDDDVPEEEKQRRVEEIMLIQADIAENHNVTKIDSTMTVIIDRLEDDVYIGRTQYDSPEVDGEVLIFTDYDLQIGGFYDVVITAAEGYDLHATILE